MFHPTVLYTVYSISGVCIRVVLYLGHNYAASIHFNIISFAFRYINVLQIMLNSRTG